MRNRLYLTLFAIATCSCTRYDCSFVNLTDEEKGIVEKAYSESYRYPEGFNFPKNLDGAIYYENTISNNPNQTSSIELHTNDKQQARVWSETGSLNSAYYRDIVAERETEKYFEFKRVYSLNKKDVILSRVHKSSYFIPSIDYFHPTNVLGTLKKAPINEETTKDFVEYIWTSQIIGYNDKVLEFKITDDADKVQYNLKSFSLIRGDFSMPDEVEVNNFDFFVDKQSGTVTFESSKIREITGTCR